MSKFNPIKVRYINKQFKSWFGDKDYEANPRHVSCVRGEPVDWRIIDRDGDSYTIAKGTLDEGLVNGWIIVSQ